jgi:DNA-binding transcriptional LysR family regulator
MHNAVLRYVDEVARQGSIRKAAKVLNVASSAVNRQILKLEEEFGLRVFDRTPDGVELTPAGEILVTHARQTLFDFERMRTEIADIRGLRSGHVRLATLDSLTFVFIPDVLGTLMREHPGLTFTIQTTGPDEVVEAVASGAADLGMSFTRFQHPDVRVRFEKPTPFGAIVTPNHPLASRRFATLEECAGYPFARTLDLAGKALFLEEEARARGLAITTSFYSNSLVMTKYAIRAGRGIGIFTKLGFSSEIASGELRFIPLVETGLANYRLGVLTSASKHLGTPGNLLLKALERSLRQSDFSN